MSNQHQRYIPRYKQRPAMPVVSAALVRRPPDLPSPQGVEIITNSHCKRVKKAAAAGREMRPLRAQVDMPIHIDPGVRVQLAPDGRPKVRSVIAATLSASGLSHALFVGGSRSQDVVLWRQASMYLARELTDASLHELGRHYHRDHSTVLYAINLVAANPERFKEQVRLVRESLR